MKRSLRLVGVSLLLAAGLWLATAVWRDWWLAALILIVIELLVSGSWRPRPRDLVRVVAGLATILALSSYPVSAVGRLAVAGIYVIWRSWLSIDTGRRVYLEALITQVLVLEGIFVWAAVTDSSRTLVVIFIWLSSLVIARDVVGREAPELTTLIAAAWALVSAELAWVLMSWLVTYVVAGEILLVPQPVLILGGVAYCFGSIWVAQRQGKLSRGRLLEYVVVGSLILAVVVIGTSWRATI